VQLPKFPKLPTPPSPPAAPTPPAVPPLPAGCADCVTTLQLSKPGALPQSIPYKVQRAADGKMRLDYGPTSVITDPAAQKMTLLNHLTKEVKILPLPKPQIPGMPAVPGMPMPGGAAMPATALPGMSVKDLGKKMVEGIEVQGHQFTLPPLKPPGIPGAPQAGAPGAPGIPGMPGAPGLPGVPKLPAPTIAEVWTSTKTQLPVLSRISGPFGKQTCICKNVAASEPHPSQFQIPSGYKLPGAPAMPQPPAMPKLP
jgi:hypothetical protein